MHVAVLGPRQAEVFAQGGASHNLTQIKPQNQIRNVFYHARGRLTLPSSCIVRKRRLARNPVAVYRFRKFRLARASTEIKHFGLKSMKRESAPVRTRVLTRSINVNAVEVTCAERHAAAWRNRRFHVPLGAHEPPEAAEIIVDTPSFRPGRALPHRSTVSGCISSATNSTASMRERSNP